MKDNDPNMYFIKEWTLPAVSFRWYFVLLFSALTYFDLLFSALNCLRAKKPVTSRATNRIYNKIKTDTLL